VDLNELIVFARVVEARSFTAAARLLGIPKSTLSRKVSALEERLGSQLLSRTTRTLSLTDVGEVYYEHCARVVAEVDAAERAVGALSERPMGRLRVTAPLGFSFLGPAIAGFGARHPEVEVEVTSTDRVVDLVSERFDVAIRAGPLVDSTLIAKPLGGSPQVLVASKRWCARGARWVIRATSKAMTGSSSRRTRACRGSSCRGGARRSRSRRDLGYGSTMSTC
jgi:DNA-binding transcriptional LysR family regulator